MRTDIKIIAAVGKNWEIGYQNELLFHLKKDMAFFRDKTIGNTVVMGRKTLESFPGGRPLPERKNIVLTRREDQALIKQYEKGNPPMFFHSMETVLEFVSALRGEVYVIGGGQVYREFLPFVSEAFITKVDCEKKADTWFPDLDAIPGWQQVSASETYYENGTGFCFVHYRHTLDSGNTVF